MAFAMEHLPLVELSLDTAIPTTANDFHSMVGSSNMKVRLYLLSIFGVEYFPRMHKFAVLSECICCNDTINAVLTCKQQPRTSQL